MKMIDKKCPKCGSDAPQYSHGMTGKGHKRYRCQECKKTYILEETNYDEKFKNRAIQLYLEGNSGRAVARFFKFGKSTFWSWLREYEAKLPKTEENDVQLIEQDELYTYIKKRESGVSDDDGGAR